MSEVSKVARPKRRVTALALLQDVFVSERSKAGAALLATGTTVVLTLVLAIWAMPWVPIGMTWDDYTPAVRVSAVLAVGSALTGVIGAYLRGVAGRKRGLVEIWQGLFGRRARLRNRQQFHNRLVRECRRARRDRRSFLSLILVRVEQDNQVNSPEAMSALERVAQVVVATVRSSDVTGIAGDSEIGILAIGADAAARGAIVGRLKRALAARSVELAGSNAPGQGAVSLGAVTLDHADIEPDLLLADARASLSPVAASRRKAAAA
jgi:diguanylate cyclase (GGDEF)-like protein